MTPDRRDGLSGKRIRFSVHAIERMFRRGITEQDVHTVVRTGNLVESYPDDTPYPSRLLLGWIGPRALHVVLADIVDEDAIVVITVYEPDDRRWLPGWIRRRR